MKSPAPSAPRLLPRGQRMRRREFVVALGCAAAVWPLGARAQQRGKLYRIGILEPIPAAQNAANLDALRKGLRDLGYVEGQNLVIEYRSADGRAERFPRLASELVNLEVDLIVTRGTQPPSRPKTRRERFQWLWRRWAARAPLWRASRSREAILRGAIGRLLPGSLCRPWTQSNFEPYRSFESLSWCGSPRRPRACPG
jgi:hypothetical protein